MSKFKTFKDVRDAMPQAKAVYEKANNTAKEVIYQLFIFLFICAMFAVANQRAGDPQPLSTPAVNSEAQIETIQNDQ